MGLDNYEWLDDSPQLATGREESHEQYQEKARKAQIQLKKIQKDEKFAQNDNQKLFLILSRFIQDSYFESLIGEVSALLNAGVSSRVIIAFIALFYPDATFYVADSLDKKEKMKLLLSLPRYEEKIEFHEQNIFPEIRTWISEWILMTELFLTDKSASVLMNKKTFEMMRGQHSALIERILSNFLIFFFGMRNVILPEHKAREFAKFIKKNISDKLEKYFAIQEKNIHELITDIEFNSDDLFGA